MTKIRPARKPHLRLERSARAQLKLVKPAVAPALTSQSEKFTAIARELPPLMENHWRAVESPDIPLDIDWDRYFALDVVGSLHWTTARFGDTLVGYISNLVGPHLHSRSTLHAQIDMFWLDPVYREPWFVLGWFRDNDAMLKGLGVKRITAGTKMGYKDGRVGSIFKRLGYHQEEQLWMKVF